MNRRSRTRLFVRSLEDRTAPATFTVLNLNDSGADSFRDCISKANNAAGADTVTFDAGLNGTISLTSGEIAIGQAVNIQGPGSSILSISGNNASRILNISTAPAAASIVISNLTFTGGLGSGFSSSGGAILGNNQSVQITACAFSGNKSAGFFNGIGGAIMLQGGTLTATACQFTGNTAATRGGALAIQGTGCKLTLDGCTLSGNSAGDGGGVYVNDNLTIGNSTISGNSATGTGGTSGSSGVGGGIRALGTFAAGITILNSTLSGNSANFGGGAIATNSTTGTVSVQNSTITLNSASGGSSGGGIAQFQGTLSLDSSVVSGNSNAASPDISSTGTVNVTYSAIGSGAGFTKTDKGGNLPFQPHANLKLGPLADNGGPTLTHMPAFDSPLVNAGHNSLSLPATDQRGPGFQRLLAPIVDIGAVEVLNLVVMNSADSGRGSLRQTVSDANSHNGADTITFASSVSGTIALTTGVIPIYGATAFNGPGASNVTVSGNNASTIFDTRTAPPGAAISFSGLTLTGGSGANGGAILGTDESLVLTSCELSGNTAALGNGGAVFMGPAGSITASHCSFTGNAATGTFSEGGAIFGYHVSLDSCTVSGNSAKESGGGIGVDASKATGLTLTIDNCTISGNMAGDGAGIVARASFAVGGLTVRNSTISGNTAPNGFGGGIVFGEYSGSPLVIKNCTITANSAPSNGGGMQINGGLQLDSTIIAQNISNSNFGADIESINAIIVPANNCIVGVADSGNFILFGAGNSTGIEAAPFNAKLGPLADNGGPTQTHMPLPGSPAINAGNNSAGLTNDQRGPGFARAVGAPDIGAVEIQAPPCVTGETVTINDGAAQRSRVTSIRVDFDQKVSLPANSVDAFRLERITDNALVGLSANVTNDSTTHVTLTFTAGAIEAGTGLVAPFSLQDGRFKLTIFADQVAGEGGQLDGNCDGTGGDNFVLASAAAPNPPTNIFRFFGDVDGDGDVDAANFLAFRDVFLGITPYNPALDFDGSGSVDAADFLQFRNRFLLGGI